MGDWRWGPDPDQPGQMKWLYDQDAPTPSVEVTQIRPHTREVLDAIHGDAPEAKRAGDIGDWIDPNAPDPTPDEVVDRSDPNYVDPWFGA